MLSQEEKAEPWTVVLGIKIPAIPVAQPRARATVRSFGGKPVASVYNPRTVGKGSDRKEHPSVLFKATVRSAVMSVWKDAPLLCPLRVDARFVFPRPANMTWKTRPMPRVPHVKKPDRDNVDKALMDALTGLLWKDDCQVSLGTLEKWIASGDESPHVYLRVSVWNG